MRSYWSSWEKHPNIAKGFVKGDRVLVEAQWKKLADSLNSLGPPLKDVNGWKKAWTDWKAEVRKKLAHNRVEATATGGGPFKQFTLLETKETVARVTGMLRVVEGISASTSFGLNEEVMSEGSNDDGEMPSTSSAAANLNRSESETPRKRRMEKTLQDSIKTFLKDESSNSQNVVKHLNVLTDIGKENKSSLRRVYRSLEKLTDVVVGLQKDFKEHEQERTILAEKNTLKEKLLQIEGLKLTIMKREK